MRNKGEMGIAGRDASDATDFPNPMSPRREFCRIIGASCRARRGVGFGAMERARLPRHRIFVSNLTNGHHLLSPPCGSTFQ